MYDSSVHYLLFNMLMVVQVFFFLSGFMLVYLRQVQPEGFTTRWFSVPKIIVLRWFRLTPTSAFMLAVTASWARYFGSGPLWHGAVTLGPTTQCRKYWWSHLLYINNMIPDNVICMVQTWHIAADTQMFIFGVIVHTATRRGGRSLTFSLLLIVGMLAAAVPVWFYDYDAYHLLTLEYVRTLTYATSETFHYVHVRGYMNLPCFLLGMSTGYLGHHLQNRGVDLSKNKALKVLSWCFLPLMVGVIHSGYFFYTTELRGSVLARVGYAVTHRAALGLLCSAWVLALISRCNQASRVLFSWRGWVVAGKLSYCVYIIHIIFLHYYIGIKRSVTDESLLDIVFITFGVLMASFALAVPMYLIIEAPFCKIIKRYWETKGFEEKKHD